MTAIAGFGVLALSDITMLRDFGLVTLIDLSVSLIGVLVALPAALVLAACGRRGRAARASRCDRAAPRASASMSRPEPRLRRTPAPAPLRRLRRGCWRCVILVLITINTIVTKPNGVKGIAPGATAARRSRCRSRWAI